MVVSRETKEVFGVWVGPMLPGDLLERPKVVSPRSPSLSVLQHLGDEP